MLTLGYYDDSAGHGGTTQYLVELISALDRRRFRPVVFSAAPAPWHEAIRGLDAEVVTGSARTVNAAAPAQGSDEVRRPIRPVPRPRPSLLAAGRQTLGWHLGVRRETAELAALFRSRRVDLLHSNNVGEEVAPIAARSAGYPWVIGTLHVDPTYDLLEERSAPRFRRLQTRSLQALDVAIAVSARTEEEWRRHLHLDANHAPRVVVIPNGIRADRLRRRRSLKEAKAAIGIADDDLVIGSLGRLDYAKGYADLLDALPAVLAHIPKARFVHAGTGVLSAALADHARRLGVAERITWLGFRAEVRDLLEATDLYVQPSWCEAHTLSVLEAGALSLPVVASDVGGHAETLAPTAGWIVPARDPAALARELLAALLDAGERQRRGERLGERVRTRYTQTRMVAETMAQYDLLLHGVRR